MKKLSENAFFYILSVLGIAVFSGLIFAAYGKITKNVFAPQHGKTPTIIIDPGHGGEDGGAVGVDGIYEKNINLSISQKLKNLLEASGYKIIMTRDEDKATYDIDSGTLRQKKRSDLKNRLELIKNNTNDTTIFVSIHQNKFSDSQYFGSQIFYSRNNSLSQELASYIKAAITGLIQPENTREIKPADKNIFLLHNAHIPAIIVECGFLSNDTEAHKLLDENYQNQIAFCVFCGISNYFVNL